MDNINNKKLEKIKKELEGIISQDATEVEQEEQVIKEVKKKKQLLKANEQIER